MGNLIKYELYFTDLNLLCTVCSFTVRKRTLNAEHSNKKYVLDYAECCSARLRIILIPYNICIQAFCYRDPCIF